MTHLPVEPIHALREAAVGPSGAVLVGRRETSSRPVAIKVLRLSSRRDATHVGALVAQSRRLGEIGHPAIVAARELARVGRWVAIVSPWVEGVDLLELTELLREREVRIPPRVVFELVHPVAAALDAASTRSLPGQEPLGVQHRDLKPSNIMVDRDGSVRVLDFGLGFTSLAGRNAVKGALQAGVVKYLSPTRRLGQRGGAASDIYALGVLAIELFRGRSLLRLHLNNPAHDRYLAEVVARLAFPGPQLAADEHALRSVLLRMVGHDPDGRPTAAEVSATFAGLAARGTGQELEGFAWEHVRALIPEVPLEADPDVEGTAAFRVDDLDDFPDTPFVPEEPEASEEADWIETADGWRVADADDEETTWDPLPPAPPGLRAAPPGSAPATATLAAPPVATVPSEPPGAPVPRTPAPGPSTAALPARPEPADQWPWILVMSAGAAAFLAAGMLALALWWSLGGP